MTFLQFNFATGEMMCDDVANIPDSRCPGTFKLNCPDDDVGSGFTAPEDCQVYQSLTQISTCFIINQSFQWCPNGGFIMNNDCTEAFTCYSILYPNGGRSLKCPEGSRVAVDFYTLE